jgi:hypothetical protein
MINPKTVNQWRFIPRIAMLFYFTLVWKTANWFMTLPDPSAEQAGFAGAVVGAAAVWFGFYVNSGASLKELEDVGS